MAEGELFRKFHTLKARFSHFGIINVAKDLNDLETIISQNKFSDLDEGFKAFQISLKISLKQQSHYKSIS